MNIDDRSAEVVQEVPIPSVVELWISVIRYSPNPDVWFCGPSGNTKEAVLQHLQSYASVEEAKLFVLRLPR